jgi:uncharacterized protein DUF5317
MLIAVVALAVAVCVPLIGGRYATLGQLRIRGAWLVYGALGIQIAIISVFDIQSELVSRGLHIVTYAMIGVCLALNRTVRWLWIVAAGWLCNFIAIVFNAGVMPIASSAEQPVGGTTTSTTFENSAPVAGARLTFLSDIFTTPRSLPMANTLSIGDVLLLVGVAIVIFAASRAPDGTRDGQDGCGQDTWVAPAVPAATSHVLTNSTGDAASN